MSVWFSRKLYKLQAMGGSATIKIPNIPKCTLPPHPAYQTFLFDFLESSSETTGDEFLGLAYTLATASVT